MDVKGWMVEMSAMGGDGPDGRSRKIRREISV